MCAIYVLVSGSSDGFLLSLIRPQNSIRGSFDATCKGGHHWLELPHFERASDMPLNRFAGHLHTLLCLDADVGSSIDDLNFRTGVVLLDGSDDRIDIIRHAQNRSYSVLHGVAPFSTQST